MEKSPGGKIFRDNTISDDGWAFHYGGRKELQFNIGIEEEGFRYGIAFSLEPSQTLPDVSILYPKILKLNCIIQERPDFFKEYRMWYWKNSRSNISAVSPISPDIISPHTFIFIGKICDQAEINYPEVLSSFDELLEIYVEVEKESTVVPHAGSREDSFSFGAYNAQLPLDRDYSTQEREISIDIRHSILQSALATELSINFGKNNVSLENPISGNKIDIVLNTEDGFHFYEVKVASSAKSCIRQAMGQLFEYAFWPGLRHASKIVVAGEHPMDEEARQFINFLQKEFHLPIEYKKINV